MYFVKTPEYLKRFLPNLIWEIPEEKNTLYLTFDDGPVQIITEKVLDILKQNQIHATFFCVGENVKRNPEIYQRILSEGHAIGNHTQHHVNGWKTHFEAYIQDIETCAQVVQSNIFRPPYGRIGIKQLRYLMQHYQIVMWDILSGDFDANISPENCYHNVIDHAKGGSIIVFHDSVKAANNMLYALPKSIDYFLANGYQFKTLHLLQKNNIH